MIKFTSKDIQTLPGRKNFYYFGRSMISTCSPAFDACDNNYDVEGRLRAANVITSKNRTDTEWSALYVNFSTRKAGENFITRLNKYLLTRE